MATYEYMCEDKHVTAEVRPMTAETKEVIQCDVCERPAKRIYSSPGVQFKGTGFYSNGG